MLLVVIKAFLKTEFNKLILSWIQSQSQFTFNCEVNKHRIHSLLAAIHTVNNSYFIYEFKQENYF